MSEKTKQKETVLRLYITEEEMSEFIVKKAKENTGYNGSVASTPTSLPKGGGMWCRVPPARKASN